MLRAQLLCVPLFGSVAQKVEANHDRVWTELLRVLGHAQWRASTPPRKIFLAGASLHYRGNIKILCRGNQPNSVTWHHIVHTPLAAPLTTLSTPLSALLLLLLLLHDGSRMAV